MVHERSPTRIALGDKSAIMNTGYDCGRPAASDWVDCCTRERRPERPDVMVSSSKPDLEVPSMQSLDMEMDPTCRRVQDRPSVSSLTCDQAPLDEYDLAMRFFSDTGPTSSSPAAEDLRDKTSAQDSDMGRQLSPSPVHSRNCEHAIRLIRRSHQDKVSIDVEYGDGKSLKIRRLRPGLLTTWNEDNPDLRVDAGDFFTKINNTSGDSKMLLHELLTSQSLDIVVRKATVLV